ncbi:hypothetical protein ACHAAC_09245 [Aeromicrobium sp. CF4.19]|uniref:hypothetical protein n=1 Tax=Aeromicrobium sp. CF4.19 TaxID=3373082 RepID=UPI003EE54352
MTSNQRTIARGIALAAAGAATAAVTVATGPAAQAGEPRFVDACDLSKTVTEIQDYGANDSNIVVYRADHAEKAEFDGIVAEGEIQEYGCDEVTIVGKRTFKWVEFTGEGEFVRKGDGGYRNWAFAGVFDRNDNHVTFHAR